MVKACYLFFLLFSFLKEKFTKCQVLNSRVGRSRDQAHSTHYITVVIMLHFLMQKIVIHRISVLISGQQSQFGPLYHRGYYYASLFDAGKLRCVIYLINVLTPGEHLYSQLYHRVGSNTCSIQALDCFLVSKNHPTVNPTILLVSVLVLSSTNLISHSRMDVTASCRPFSAVYLSGLVLFSNFCSLVSLGRSVTCSFW